MKLKYFVVCAFLFIGAQIYGQTEIYGTWTAHCSFEKAGLKSISTSSLCPVVQESDSSISILSVKMAVDSTHISFGESKDKITYIKRPSNNGITFVKDRNPYSFEIVATTSDKFVILRSKNGHMLLLERAEQ